MDLFEVGQPHRQIVVAGVVLCEGDLSPAHGPIKPGGRVGRGGLCEGGGGDCGEEFASGHVLSYQD